jgi:hypothetical protein
MDETVTRQPTPYGATTIAYAISESRRICDTHTQRASTIAKSLLAAERLARRRRTIGPPCRSHGHVPEAFPRCVSSWAPRTGRQREVSPGPYPAPSHPPTTLSDSLINLGASDLARMGSAFSLHYPSQTHVAASSPVLFPVKSARRTKEEVEHVSMREFLETRVPSLFADFKQAWWLPG